MLFIIIVYALFAHMNCIIIGTIENSIIAGTINGFFLNMTLGACVCTMVQSNGSISSLNYFQTNQTCQLFNNSINLSFIRSSSNSFFMFLNQSLISSQIMTTSQPTVVTSASTSLIHALWSFDGDVDDTYSNYDGVEINNPSYYSPGINGFGSALRFNASLNQSVLMASTPNLNLSYRSFTFELWIYPFSFLISPEGDRGIIGHCQIQTTNKCLHLTLRGNRVRMSFFGNACDGSSTMVANIWYHLAFVYDYIASTQTIYINGIANCTHTSSGSLQITNSTPLTIGFTAPYNGFFFDGLIDQVSLVGWAKNSSEIVDDATLVASYSFGDTSFNDSGPNGINGIGVNTTIGNNSILLNETTSYFQAAGFVLLGTNNRSYSFSLWINPFQTNGSTILHVSLNQSGGGQWCSPYIGFNAIGQICAQSRTSNGLVSVIGPSLSTHVWTHIAETYSPSNGISLYVNGSLFNSSTPCDYRTNQTPLIITLGSSLQHGNDTCESASIQPGQYSGWMDEFHVYSRELTATDVKTLSVR